MLGKGPQGSHSSNVFTLMVFKFYPSKGLTGNSSPPSLHKNTCATFGTLKQEEYHGPYHGR